MSAAEIGMSGVGLLGEAPSLVVSAISRLTDGEFRGEREIGEDYLEKKGKRKEAAPRSYHKNLFLAFEAANCVGFLVP
jgi:hypothetical protein